jgi:YidC/Oxa1 family membrane protein insertase
MDENRRRWITLLGLPLLIVGVYFGYTQFFGPDEPPADPPATETGGGERPGEPSSDIDYEARARAQRTATIETDDFRATVTNLNGAFTSFELLRERYHYEDGRPENMVTTELEQYLPFRVEIPGANIPADAVWEIEQVDPERVRLRWSDSTISVVNELVAGQGPYQVWSTVTVRNTGTRPRTIRAIYNDAHYVAREDESSGFLFGSRSPKLSHGICYWGDEEVTRVERELGVDYPVSQPHGHGMGPDVVFAGIENTYFANVMAPNGVNGERCQIRATEFWTDADEDPIGTVFETRLVYPRTELAAGDTHVFRTMGYFGPKDNAALSAAGHHLSEVVDLGWFSVVAVYFVMLLRIIHGFVGNWGVAIILMTILFRLALLPLTWTSFRSMARMRVLKPEMDRINQLYGDDREKKGAAIMELYRRHKINPVGGCLPTLLQMPLFFAFYASLSTNVELYHANFALWWTDLSSPDPYYVLPLALGVLMHVQQRITPAALDPMQQKMMLYFMPIMITAFMLFLPAGLCLYSVTNSVLGIAQQQWIHRSLNRKTAATAAGPSGGDKPPEASPSGPMALGPGSAGPQPSEASSESQSSDASSVVSRQKPRDLRLRKASRRRTRRA